MGEIKWIKICTDIFADENILLIEALPEADSIIVIWFKLLCMAGIQNNCGIVTFKDKIPYTDEMLSVIMRRPINTVRIALETFERFGMIERSDNGIISIPNWEKHQNVEGMEKVREQGRLRQQKYRENQRLALTENAGNKPIEENVTLHNVTVTEQNKNKNKIKNKNNNINTDIEKGVRGENKKTVYFENEELNTAFMDFVKMRKSIKKPMTDRAITMAINKLSKLAGDNDDLKIQIVNQSIYHSWQDLYELKEDKPQEQKKPANQFNNYKQNNYDYDALLNQIKAN